MEHHEGHRPEGMTQYLAENINGRLVISLRDISHTMRSLYEGRGSQKRVLIVLSGTGTITQRELTQRLGIQPGSASEVIAKLESAGLVERSASEEDRRTANISLTGEGRRQAGAALEQRRQRHEEMFSALTQEEKERLLSLLEKVNSDWQARYGGREEPFGGRRHGHRRGREFEDRADGEGRSHHRHGGDGAWEGRRGCDHDCANCPQPCGRGRNRQA